MLDKYGQRDSTLFIIASDNGAPYVTPPYNAPFKGGKGTGWLGGSHCPLIMTLPGQTLHAIVDDPVSTADILPTALDFAGIEIPGHIDGRSLKPLLTGETDKGPHDIVFSSGLHATRWSFSYFGEKIFDSDRCPLFAWAVTRDHVLLYLTATPAGLYETYPDGLPPSMQLSELSSDPKQSSDLSFRRTHG